MTLDIVTREEWGARKPRRRHEIELPTPELWLHHTAGPMMPGLRAIQNVHMDGNGWSDIAYSFLVGSTGQIIEGRGAGVAGGHTRGRNTVSHAICAIGNYETTRPSAELLGGIAQLVAHGYRQGWWPDQITGAHSDAPGLVTLCCGRYLRSEIPAINERVRQLLGETKMEEIGTELTKFVQSYWNNENPDSHALVVDGAWGPKTDAVVTKEWLVASLAIEHAEVERLSDLVFQDNNVDAELGIHMRAIYASLIKGANNE